MKINQTFGRFLSMVIKSGNEILIKSAQIISTLGLENYSMQKLASELGINKASLYHYYKSKEAIIDAMHEYYHGLLMKRGYKITLTDDVEKNLIDLIEHWQGLFFSDEMYDYLRCLLIMRAHDERAYEEWRSISLTIDGQSQVVIAKHTKQPELISPLFSSMLEINLERALISGDGRMPDSIASTFSYLLHRL